MTRPTESPAGRTGIHVNLMPDDLWVSQALRSGLKGWSAALAVSLLLLAIPLGIDWMQRSRAEELRDWNRKSQQELAAIRVEIKELEVSTADALLHLQRAEALRAKRAWSGVLAVVTGMLPERCWLTSVATDPAAPTASSSAVRATVAAQTPGTPRPPTAVEEPVTVTLDAPRKLVVSGYAAGDADPLVFVARLKETGLFQDVVLHHSSGEPVADGIYHRFEISCTW